MDDFDRIAYYNARMYAYYLIIFMLNHNFYDKSLKSKLEILIDHITNFLTDEC